MGVPVGSVKKAGGFLSAIGQQTADLANGISLTMQKPAEKLHSLAILIVYSMAQDAPAPAKTPQSGPTPSSSSANLAGLANGAASPPVATFLAGSKALDSLAKLVQALESFFHPSAFGKWTPTLARFLQNMCVATHIRRAESAAPGSSSSAGTRSKRPTVRRRKPGA